MLHRIILFLMIVFFASSCKKEIRSNEISFKFIQLNDVYEIAPFGGGKYGGMARVAHVRDSIKNENPNTFMFMAGDFLSPSLLGTLKVDGEILNGKQMVEVMNAMDFDLVTFGNHEFDLKEGDLQKRLNESQFQWVSSNIKQVQEHGNVPFSIQGKDTIPIPTSFILNVHNEIGDSIKIGFVSATLPSNPKKYVHYEDIHDSTFEVYEEIKKDVDLLMGLTHLEIEQDQELVKKIKDISFIMGGHEHNNMLVNEGNSLIAKTDANAKSLYIHTFTYNKETKDLNIKSELFPVDDQIATNTEVEAIVSKWVRILELQLKEVVEDPSEVIYVSEIPFDGTDSANRGIQTNLGDMITEAMAWSFNNEVDAALVNGGSIRIDDILPNELTVVDIFRTLPFGGGVLKVDLKGKLLIEVLDYGKEKRGTGAYLQRYNVGVDADSGVWLIDGEIINPDKTYTIAFSDFLLKGFDIPFLTPANKDVLKIYTPTNDEIASNICNTIILYLKSLKENSYEKAY